MSARWPRFWTRIGPRLTGSGPFGPIPTRAFTLLLRFEGKPVAVPLSEAEAMGFPAHKRACLPGGVTWLAVGLDPEMRASYALQSAAGPDRAAAHEAARELALSRLTGLCATPGFPMGPPRGRA